MSKTKELCFKFNVLAKPEHHEEYVRYVYANSKENALRKLEGSFIGYEIKQVILVDRPSTKRRRGKTSPLYGDEFKYFEFHVIDDDECK